MSETIYLEAVERILSAIYSIGDRRLSSFMFGKPGCAQWEKRFGTEIFVQRKDYIQALLFIRQNGAPYLKVISISELWSMVTSFITENFWHVCGDHFFTKYDGSFADLATVEGKLQLAVALEQSPMFKPTTDLTLFPLISIRVIDNFETARFF